MWQLPIFLNSRFGDIFLFCLDFSLLRGSYLLICLFQFFILTLVLKEVLGSQKYWEKGKMISHIPPARYAYLLLPLLTFLKRVVHLLQLMNLHRPTIITLVHSAPWCCMFCGFGQMYTGIYHLYSIIRSIFSKNLLCSAYLSLPSA